MPHSIHPILLELKEQTASAIDENNMHLANASRKDISLSGQSGQIHHRNLRALQRCSRLLASLEDISTEDSPQIYANALFAAKVFYDENYRDDNGGAWRVFAKLESYLERKYWVSPTLRLNDLRGIVSSRHRLANIIFESSFNDSSAETLWTALHESEQINISVARARRAVLGYRSFDDPAFAYLSILANSVDQTESSSHVARLLSCGLALKYAMPLMTDAEARRFVDLNASKHNSIDYFIYETPQARGALRYFAIQHYGCNKNIKAWPTTLEKSKIDEAIFRIVQELAYAESFEHCDSDLLVLSRELLPVLDEAHKLIAIGPIGKLWRLPFEALSVSGRPFGTLCSLYYANGPALGSCEPGIDESAAANIPLCVGACEYDKNFGYGGRIGIRGLNAFLEPLEGSRAEVLSAAKAIQGKVLLGEEAIKSAILECKNPKVLHIASHGFFVDDSSETHMHGDDLHQEDRPYGYVTAGIAFSGANANINDRGEMTLFSQAILTDAEIATMQLGGTQLVVLSCCDSARAAIDTVSGPNGLVKAFFAAGARTALCSHWPLQDAIAAQFCKDFYLNLIEGLPLIEAMHAARCKSFALYCSPNVMGFALIHSN